MDREFSATAPNQLRVAALTSVRTHAGWIYVAFVLDVFSRLVVGWQVSTSLQTDLAQYRAIRYTERLAEAVASVGSKGDSYD